jgi:AcrB/AcrD/AcrF family
VPARGFETTIFAPALLACFRSTSSLEVRPSRGFGRPAKAECGNAVIAVVPLMLLLMITVLMFHLQSFQRLFVVLSVAPLGLIGVVGALLLTGRPLGFVAILGILALIGMITKNAVILIGQIEAERAQGKDVFLEVDVARPIGNPPSPVPSRGITRNPLCKAKLERRG